MFMQEVGGAPEQTETEEVATATPSETQTSNVDSSSGGGDVQAGQENQNFSSVGTDDSQGVGGLPQQQAPEQLDPQQQKDLLIQEIIGGDASLQSEDEKVAAKIREMYEGMPTKALQEILADRQENLLRQENEQPRDELNTFELQDKWLGKGEQGGIIRDKIIEKYGEQIKQEILQNEQQDIVQEAQQEHLDLFFALQQDAALGDKRLVSEDVLEKLEQYLQKNQAEIQKTVTTKLEARVRRRIQEKYEEAMQNVDAILEVLLTDEQLKLLADGLPTQGEVTAKTTTEPTLNESDSLDQDAVAQESSSATTSLEEDKEALVARAGKAFNEDTIGFLQELGIQIGKFTGEKLAEISSDTFDGSTFINFLMSGHAAYSHRSNFRKGIENYDRKKQVGVSEFKGLVEKNQGSESVFKTYDKIFIELAKAYEDTPGNRSSVVESLKKELNDNDKDGLQNKAKAIYELFDSFIKDGEPAKINTLFKEAFKQDGELSGEFTDDHVISANLLAHFSNLSQDVEYNHHILGQ
jgi:hypothetical protein